MPADRSGPAPVGLAIGPDDAVAIESASASWSYGELGAAADALAVRLAALLPRHRTRRVGHVFDLSPVAVVAAHAVARADAVLAVAHPRWGRDRLDAFVSGIEPDGVLARPGYEWPGRWEREALALPGFGPVDLLTRLDEGKRAASAPPGTDVMLLTSGTTGAPRIVCHSWARLRVNARAANARGEAGRGSVVLATLAWAHVGGLAIVVRAGESGGRIVTGPGEFDADRVAGALEHHGVTHISLVPVMLERLLDAGAAPPGALVQVLVGGAATPPRLLDRALAAGWPVSLTYGLTEAGSQVATATPADVEAGRSALDRPLDGVELELRDEGEIFVRSDSLMLDVLGGAVLDDGAGSGSSRAGPRVDGDGWLATGDLAAPDERGRLEVVARRSSRIVTGGTNVDPGEIEEVLRGHELVSDACVVALPDEKWGEVVAAVVEGAPGGGAGDSLARADAAAVVAELDRWCRARFDAPRRPRRWVLVDDLPRTPTGKVDRAAATAIATEAEEMDR